MTARINPSQARSIDKRDRILDAAQALIHEKGYGALTIADVARRADVGKPSVYRLFADKQAILVTLADRRANLLDAAAGEAFAKNSGEDLDVVVRAMTTAIFDAVQADPTLDSVFATVLTVPALRERDRVQMRERGRVLAQMAATVMAIPYREEMDVTGVATALVTISISRHALQYQGVFADGLLEEAVAHSIGRWRTYR